MTNKELAAALRLCGGTTGVEECRAECPFFRGADVGQCVPVMTAACADALANSETHVLVLQKEIEKLRAQLEMAQNPQWVSVEERLPHFNQPYIVTACDENAPYGEGIWYSTVVVVAEYYNGCWTWDENGTEYDLTGLVTHWMPLPEPPSTAESPTGQKG